MAGDRERFRVIEGGCSDCAPKQRIALSLVNPFGRIDVPLSAIFWIEAYGETTFADESGRILSFPLAHVAICVRPDFRERIFRLSRQIIGQTLDIVVGGKTVLSPVVREPLCCADNSFNLSANDFEEAQALAQLLRTGWRGRAEGGVDSQLATG